MKILHNPRCSKSRETLALITRAGAEVEVVEYLKDPPTPAALKKICAALGVEVKTIIRNKEKLFKELGLSP